MEERIRLNILSNHLRLGNQELKTVDMPKLKVDLKDVRMFDVVSDIREEQVVWCLS